MLRRYHVLAAVLLLALEIDRSETTVQGFDGSLQLDLDRSGSRRTGAISGCGTSVVRLK